MTQPRDASHLAEMTHTCGKIIRLIWPDASPDAVARGTRLAVNYLIAAPPWPQQPSPEAQRTYAAQMLAILGPVKAQQASRPTNPQIGGGLELA
jgi:hypothetical protein